MPTYGFSELGDVERVNRVVKAAEASLDLTDTPNAQRRGGTDTVTARLVTVDGTDAWKVTTWKHVRRLQDGTYEDMPGGLTDVGGQYPAVERMKRTAFTVGASTGDVVLLKREAVKMDDASISYEWVFDAPPIAPPADPTKDYVLAWDGDAEAMVWVETELDCTESP